MSLHWRAGLRYNEKATDPGAQTERRGEAGPVSALLGSEGSPADSAYFRHSTATPGTDNEPANQAPSSVAACPDAAKIRSVAETCGTDVVPETAGRLLSTTGGANGSGVSAVAIPGIGLMVFGKSEVALLATRSWTGSALSTSAAASNPMSSCALEVGWTPS